MIGEVIDEKYKITRLIGEGGMGAVFEGENLLISRRVAIKVLHAAMAMNEQTVERFQREARAAGRIGNDHILEVLDLGKLPNGDHYMVLEFLDGEPLSGRIHRLGHMSPEQIAPIMVQVLAGLGAAHEAGIIHRDLKPDNLFILKEKAGHKDFVKIIDFGISKFNPLAGEDAQKKMTQTGAIMGTPYYMSPEQARGSLEADARSDLYSIGVIIYEAVTGQVPFDGQTINELMFAIALNDPKPIETYVPDIDPSFKNIVDRAMSKDKEARYQSAAEFADDLKAWMAGHPLPAADASAAAAAIPAEAPAGRAPANPASATASPWSTSQSDATIPTKNTPVIAATIAGAILLLGGGLFAAVQLFGGSPDEAEDGAVAAAAEASSAPLDESNTEPVVTPESAAGTDEKAEEEAAAKKKAEEEAAAKKKAEEEAAAKKKAEEEAAAKKKAEEEAAAKAAAAAPRPKPRVVARPKPRPKPVAPQPKPKPRSSFSRFGY